MVGGQPEGKHGKITVNGGKKSAHSLSRILRIVPTADNICHLS